MVIQWWCDFEVLQLKIIIYHFLNYKQVLHFVKIDVKKNSFHALPRCRAKASIYNLIKLLLSTKWQWVHFC